MSKGEIKTTERIRTITWDDPKTSARDAQSISGLDYLHSIKMGEISPPSIARLVGYKISEIERGHAVFELEPGEYHFNPFKGFQLFYSGNKSKFYSSHYHQDRKGDM